MKPCTKIGIYNPKRSVITHAPCDYSSRCFSSQSGLFDRAGVVI